MPQHIALDKTALIVSAIVAVAGVDIVRRVRHRPTHLLFAVIVGTALSVGLMLAASAVLSPSGTQNPYAMALAVLLVLLGWRALFGAWEAETKLAVLGTFLFWIMIRLSWLGIRDHQSVRLIAAGVAIVPAVIWCRLFLRYHRERLQTVVLLFLAGMLSTVPILFYDALVRRGSELQFFLFSVRPQSFQVAANSFVREHVPVSGVAAVLLTSLLSFAFVALIEEVSKYWVLSRSGRRMFASIDDVLQLSIVVAIGFSFAENVINPVYFTAFVQEYLFHAAAPDIGGFLSNVLGRSVLTSMVHIVSTGVLGYFLGIAVFAPALLDEARKAGRPHRLALLFAGATGLRTVSVYRTMMLGMGLLSAITLHGIFNFLVSLPDLLPGNPQSVADVLGGNAPQFLQAIPLLMIPALFYVVGGFWLLTALFTRAENERERGVPVLREEFGSRCLQSDTSCRL